MSEVNWDKVNTEHAIRCLWNEWWNVSHKFEWESNRIIIGLNYGGSCHLEILHDGYEWGVWDRAGNGGFQHQYYFEIVYKTLKLLNEANVYDHA